MSEQVVEDPVLRQCYIFRRATAADGAEALEVEAWVQPGVLSCQGAFTRQALPRSLRGALQLAVMARHYWATTLILRPPPFLHALLIAPLARLGELRGHRAGQF